MSESQQSLINILSRLATEQINAETTDIDQLPPLEIIRKINNEDKKVADVVGQVLPQIALAAEAAARSFKKNGRLLYIGAGTSGRLGVLDAAECPPTFGSDPSQVVGMISGGYATLVLSKEGVEDDIKQAVLDLKEINLNSKEFVIGIAASVRTPYTNSGIAYAKEIGCKTGMIVCNQAVGLSVEPDILIELPVGPEVITGSTRMKSGTAQKMVLNMISTAAMVLTGKTYGNLMVDLQARSEKLAARSRKILIQFLDIEFNEADRLLKSSGGSVKTAIVMNKLSLEKEEADRKLKKADGFLRRVIDQS